MSDERLRFAYAIAIGALFAGVALWRHDLVLGAAQATAATLARGGAERGRVLAEIVLFAGILIGAWKTIPAAANPAHDLAVLVIASAAGFAAEAWGTRLGLWTYYTWERPPLWIVPAWPLGAALVERVAARARERFGPAPAGAYRVAAAAAFSICAAFCAPWRASPAAWAGLAAVAAALWAGADAREEFWPLVVGFGAIVFADGWGTTNGCWSYYVAARPFGLARGVIFGMAFDAAVVVGCLRLARRLRA